MLKVKITQIGDSMGVVLPEEALARLKAKKGDTLCLVEGPESYTITADEQHFEEQMDTAGKIIKKYDNTLKELAK